MCLCVIFSSTSSSSSITIFFSRAVLYCTELLCVLDVCLCLCVCVDGTVRLDAYPAGELLLGQRSSLFWLT